MNIRREGMNDRGRKGKKRRLEEEGKNRGYWERMSIV
jgi:hypothetical protein